MIFQTFQKSIMKSYSTFSFKKSLLSTRNTFVFSYSDSSELFLKFCCASDTEQNKEVFKKIIKNFHKDFRSPDKKKEAVEKILNNERYLYSVIERTYLLKYNYDFLIRHFYSFSYDYNINKQLWNCFPDREESNFEMSIFDDDDYPVINVDLYVDIKMLEKMFEDFDSTNIFYLKIFAILLRAFLLFDLGFDNYILGTWWEFDWWHTIGFSRSTWIHHEVDIYYYSKKIKKNFSIAKSVCSYDTNSLTGEITKNKDITFDNINSGNLSSDNHAISQEKVSLAKYQKNQSLIKYQNPEDVFAPYAHLWTLCENCETSIYKEYAQRNKYICQHCAYHLPMESLDRIESLIDSGTWDPTDENMVSIDPYEILRKKVHIADLKQYFEQCKKRQFSFFLDTDDELQDKKFDYSFFLETNEELQDKEFDYSFFLDTDDELQDKEFDYFYFRQIWKMYLCIFYQNKIQGEIESRWYTLSFKESISALFGRPIYDDEYDDERFDKLLHKQELEDKEELEDLVNFLPSDEEELDSEGLYAEESTLEQTSAEESTSEQVSTEQTSTDTDESTVEESIAKKYTPKELVQLFLLEEIEAKEEIEEKEKNFASADDENANQNSEKSIKSEESTESQESTKSQESIESEESQESEKDIPYMDKVDSYQKETGLTDAVQTGIGKLDGIPVALAVMDFHFIGGSMGSVVGEKISRLIEYATIVGLPIIISCASGGARMQEGSFSLMQMAKISSILLNFPFPNNIFLVSLLTSPTTGGVTASFGMLGDIIIAEPDAYIAFAGKRVIEEVMKIEVPEGVQEAEYLFEKGSLDLIVPRNLLKGVLSELFKFHDFFITDITEAELIELRDIIQRDMYLSNFDLEI
jgi:acetyl-CoA carboxylase carboxyl transferase subunit beta